MRGNISFEQVNVPIVNHFVAINPVTDLPVSGLTLANFTVVLGNPLGINVVASLPVTIVELGTSGNYRTTYTPNSVGDWLLTVIHATYFPYGKRGASRVYDALYYAENDPTIVEPFAVTNASNVLVPNLTTANFTYLLYNPNGVEVSATVPVVVTEDEGSDGNYRAKYTANLQGKWLLIVMHATYFPWGKRNDTRYIDGTDDSIGIVEAVRDLIAADATIRARLATYEFTTDVSTVAVFTTDVMPEDAELPAVIINRSGGADFGTRGHEGEDAFVSVRIYANRDRRTDTIRKTAELLKKLLNRAELTVTDGYRAFRCIADPPISAADPDGFPGYLITVRVLLLD